MSQAVWFTHLSGWFDWATGRPSWDGCRRGIWGCVEGAAGVCVWLRQLLVGCSVCAALGRSARLSVCLRGCRVVCAAVGRVRLSGCLCGFAVAFGGRTVLTARLLGSCGFGAAAGCDLTAQLLGGCWVVAAAGEGLSGRLVCISWGTDGVSFAAPFLLCALVGRGGGVGLSASEWLSVPPASLL